jgi:acetyl-CoA carboxylase biotin carboxyl carrier protein
LAELRAVGAGFELRSPVVGLWGGAPLPGTHVAPGLAIGALWVLGTRHRLEVPEGAHGLVRPAPAGHGPARRPVQYGDVLLVLDPTAESVQGPEPDGRVAGAHRGGLCLRAPTSGRFYGRPAPDKPPFVTAGDRVSPGQTIGLLEVMKTFSRIVYGGADLPPRARVARVVPRDHDDLAAGDPILELEADDPPPEVP